MRSSIHRILVGAALLGSAVTASAASAEFGIGIHIGSAGYAQAPSPPVAVHQPAHMAPAHNGPHRARQDRHAPVHYDRHADERASRHGARGDGRGHR